MIFILLSVVCLHLLSSAADDPCLKYESLINEKRSALYQPALTESNICDQDLDESVWYRFQVLPPQRIHDECVPELHCGTEQPIWINGDHPTADDPGPKTVKVCSPLDDDCCGSWESTILVKFCPSVEATGDGDGFYVYRLKRVPNCDMAYCAGNSVVCTGESVWNPVRKECTDVRPNIKTPVLEGPNTVQKFLDLEKKQDYDDFYFECVVHWTDPEEELKTGGEQFEVIFTFDGNEVEKVPPKITDNSNLRVKLTSKELIGQVGKTIGCQVRSYWLKLEKFRRQYLVSERTYFVGIRYSLDNTEGSFTSPRIEIDESLPALTLYFQATVPISCPVIEGRTTCKITIKMEDSNNGLGLSSCNMVFSGLEKDRKPKIQRVKALPTPGIHQRTSVIRFRAISTNPEFFWHGYKLPDIPIFIKDTSTTGSCSSSGDPHIMTFDGRYYHAYMEGDYLLARSISTRHFEVHVRHHKCSSVTCNCAVAVREGNNVLGVNACQGPNFTPTPIVYLNDKHVPGATITNAGNVYTITMPSGAYVRMDWYGVHSSIHLYLNSEDYGKVVGLCGTFNGVAGDDTIPKGDHQADTRDIPISFTESYKLAEKESFINGHVHPIDCLEIEEQVPNTCSCQDKEAIACNAPAVKTKAFATKFTQHCNEKHPNEATLRRLRRSSESNETSSEEDDDYYDDDEEDEAKETEAEDEEVNLITETDIPLPEIDENHGRDVVPAWPTPSGISEADAQRLCRSQVEASPVYAACRDQISQQMDTLVTSCVTDVQVSDDVNQGVSSILDDFQTKCVHELETSVVRNDTDEESPPSPVEELLEQVVANICPAQCNGNGTCSNGTCICNDGFAGEDCSINIHDPPTLTSFRKDSVCDGRSTFCSETSIFASNIFQSEKLLCKVYAVDANRHFAFGGSLVSTREVMCRLPSVHRFTKDTSSADGDGQDTEVGPAPLYRWDIALTNDGSLYSNSLRLTVYDSKCQECRTDGTCVQKEETCVIGGRCFLSGDTSSANPCEICVPSRSRHEWTFVDKSECMTDSSAPWFSCSVKVLAIVTAFTIWCFVC